MKNIYVNCRVKTYMKVDHRSYRRSFCKLRKESLIQACTGFKPLTTVILVQLSYHLT